MLTGFERATLLAAVAAPAAGKKLVEVVEAAADGVASVSYSIGTETSNAIAVTITARTLQNRALNNRVALDLLIVSNTTTMAYNTNDYTIAATTGTVVELIADRVIRVVTDANGVAVVTLTIATAATCFLVPVFPSGELGTPSSAITHV